MYSFVFPPFSEYNVFEICLWLDFPDGTMIKNLPASAGVTGDMGLIPGSERSLGGGHSNPFQYACLKNAMDRRVWQATVHRVTKNWTQLKRLSMRACYQFSSCITNK